MTYKIVWRSDVVVVEFYDEIQIMDIVLANKYCYGNPEFYKTKASIFDFSKSVMSDSVSEKDLRFFAALDLGAAVSVTEHKLAIVVATEHGKTLADDYIDICRSAGAQWLFNVFFQSEEAHQWVDDEAICIA